MADTYKYAPLLLGTHIPRSAPLTRITDPRVFLKHASTVDLESPRIWVPKYGPRQRCVARRGLIVFRGQSDFIDRRLTSIGAVTLEGLSDRRIFIIPGLGCIFIPLPAIQKIIHKSTSYTGRFPYSASRISLDVVPFDRDANSTFNFESQDSITNTLWHSDVSYELQPPGLTTFFLLSQPTAGGDTLFASQVSTLKKLSPPLVVFLRTLSAVHSGVEQAKFSRAGKRGGVVRREPVEHVHPVMRRHPVTGEEALYVNRQFTRRIVGLKREESETVLNFLFGHIDKSADLPARVKWEPGTVALWDNRVTAHSAIVDYGESKERRHGARITPQAERPIPAWDGLVLSDNV